jgi:uncharacterized protein YukE
MTAEMPARIEAVPHARVVEFPWASATSVGAAIDEAAAALSASLESRAAMAGAINDWQGAYRQDFDETYLRLAAAATDLVERAPSRAQSVVSAADDANTEQTLENERAQERSWFLDLLPRA